MPTWKVTTKVVVYTCIVMGICLGVSNFIFYRFEKNRNHAVVSEYTQNIHNLLQDRKESEINTLRKNNVLITEILSKMIGVNLYNAFPTGVRNTVLPYIQFKEIKAIQVLDKDGHPFVAVWEQNGMKKGQSLPEKTDFSGYMSVEKRVVYNQKKVGLITIYFTKDMINTQISQDVVKYKDMVDGFSNDLWESFKKTMGTQIALSVFILLLLMACLVLMLRIFIFNRLSQITSIADRLSHFDLSMQLPEAKNDELGKMFASVAHMVRSLKDMIRNVQDSGGQISSSSTELAASTKEQEATFKTQAASITDTAEHTKKISEIASTLTDDMQDVLNLTQETSAVIADSQSSLHNMQEAMQSMENASKSISGRLATINEKTENITSIITTITKVADKTNLLSLNAAIEAEKAGEYGKGFTVVAREIRRLADQTSMATFDIEQMVQEMQSAVSSGVMEMDKFIVSVRNNAEDISNISSQINAVFDQVQSIPSNFENVNQAMEHQSEYAAQINSTMSQLSDEVSQTMESLEETYAAIAQLNEVAEQLHVQVSKFTLEEQRDGSC